jgi:uncharacterized protein (DUF433 family)
MSNRTQLIETISALPEDLVDQTLIYVQALQNPIRSTSGVCGGHARIRDTRIPVWTLVAYRQQGAPDEELLANYPGLTHADLAAAWDYYQKNREPIDRAIAEDEYYSAWADRDYLADDLRSVVDHRAQKESWEDFQAILAQVPDREPDPFDRL